MSLTTMSAFLFDKQVRAKGEALYATRRIYVDSSGPDRFHARVQGGDLYGVRIGKCDQGLEVWCECPYFEDYGPCKHLWTALLEADRRGALGGVREVLFLQMEEDPYDEVGPFLPTRRTPLPAVPPPPPVVHAPPASTKLPLESILTQWPLVRVPLALATFPLPERATPATAPLSAMPESKSAKLAPQTVAIDEEPLDSRMSLTMRMV